MALVSTSDDISDREIELKNDVERSRKTWLDRPCRRASRQTEVEDRLPEYVHRHKYVDAQKKIEELEAEVEDLRRRNRRLAKCNRALQEQPDYVHRTKYRTAELKIQTLEVDLRCLTNRYRKVLKVIAD